MRPPIALLFFFAFAVAGVAVFPVAQVQADGGLLPEIPEAKGERCVEPTQVMRRRHMDFILHQRDRTVHEGIRTQKHRFVRCINCHIQPDATGAYPRHTNANHFCSACHRYSSVSIDCFQCHADRPEEFYSKPSGHAAANARLSMDEMYLELLE